ncbi:tetratricopeptide repeat protein [Oceanithermus sp.]
MKSTWLTFLLLGLGFGAVFGQAPPAQAPDPAALEARLKSQPGDLPTMVALGRAYLDAGRYDDAARVFEDLLALDYQNFQAHFGLGLALYRKGDLRGALFEFDQVTRLFPDRFEGWYNLAVAYADSGRWNEAATAFQRAIALGEEQKLAPDVLRPAYLGLATAQRKLGKPDQAAQTLMVAAEKMGEDEEILYLIAENLSLAGKPKEAIPYLYKVLNKDRGNVAAVNLLADIFVGQGLMDRALRELDRSLEATQDPAIRANLLLKKAMLLKAIDPEKAAKLLEEASALDPRLWQAHYDLGSSWLRAGDPDRALRAFQKAYSVNPTEPKILVGLAAAYFQKQDYKQAYRYAQLAADSSEGAVKADALLIAGKSAYRLGRYAEARALLLRAVDLAPDRADAWLWLGLAAYALQDFDTAVPALERAVQLDPSPVAKLNLGAAYLAVKRFSDAEQILTQVVLEDPENAEAWYNLGWALNALGRESEAQRAWKAALDLGYEPARSLIKK